MCVIDISSRQVRMHGDLDLVIPRADLRTTHMDRWTRLTRVNLSHCNSAHADLESRSILSFTDSTMNPAIAVGMVFLGCCSNVIFLELIVRDVPSAGNIITFAQFFFIATEGFIFTSNFGRRKPAIPLKTYVIMVVLFFVVNVVNNIAFNFNISMPLHMIFRAGSLLGTLILNVLLLGRQYPWHKHLSVLLISVGIALATVVEQSMNDAEKNIAAEAKNASRTQQDDTEGDLYDYVQWLIGIAILTGGLFMISAMGIYQEFVYAKHGKHPSEALFYNHALPLPFFLLFLGDLYKHVVIFNQSELLLIPGLGLGLPRMWVFLLGNIFTQYVCIRGVFILTTECLSLTVTLVVTLRKFMSLVFSIIYFKNLFTFHHWIATVFVFGGTLIFTEVFSKLYAQLTKPADPEDKKRN